MADDRMSGGSRAAGEEEVEDGAGREALASGATVGPAVVAVMTREVMAAARDALGVTEIDAGRSLFDNGGDSLAMVQFMVRLARIASVDALLDVNERNLTLHQIAGQLAGAATMPAGVTAVADAVSAGDCLRPLPNRGSYFVKRRRSLFEWVFVSHFFGMRRRIGHPDVLAWLQDLLDDCDGLRIRLRSVDGGWIESIEPDRSADYLDWVKATAEGDDLQAVAEAAVASALASFADGEPLFRLVWIAAPDGRACAAIVYHHLLADGLAKRQVVDRLLRFLGAPERRRGAVGRRPPMLRAYVDDYYRHFASHHQRYLPFWREQPWDELAREAAALRAGRDPDGEGNREKATAQCVASVALGIDGAASSRLAQAELLLAALGLAFRDWRRGRHLHLGYVTHSRTVPGSRVSYLQTVGWVSEPVDIILALDGDEDAMVGRARSWLRHRTDHGRALGFMRHCHPDAAVRREAAAYPEPAMSFNFAIESTLGLSLPEGVRRLERPRVSAPPAPEAERAFLLSGGAWREQDRLVIAWDFSRRLFAEAEVAAFTEACARRLQALIDRRAARGAA